MDKYRYADAYVKCLYNMHCCLHRNFLYFLYVLFVLLNYAYLHIKTQFSGSYRTTCIWGKKKKSYTPEEIIKIKKKKKVKLSGCFMF